MRFLLVVMLAVLLPAPAFSLSCKRTLDFVSDCGCSTSQSFDNTAAWVTCVNQSLATGYPIFVPLGNLLQFSHLDSPLA